MSDDSVLPFIPHKDFETVAVVDGLSAAPFTENEVQALLNLAKRLSRQAYITRDDSKLFSTLVARDTNRPSAKDFLFTVAKKQEDGDQPPRYMLSFSDKQLYVEGQCFQHITAMAGKHISYLLQNSVVTRPQPALRLVACHS